MSSRTRPENLAAIESRLAARLTEGLTARTSDLPHDIGERLRFGRERALARARDARQTAPANGAMVVGVSPGGLAVLSGLVPWWQRAASVLPLVLLLAGLLMIDRWSVYEQVVAAAEFDAQLLSDDLPPSAYSDPGFAEYLRSSPSP